MCTHRLTARFPQVLRLDGPVELQCGDTLDSVEVAYRTWGALSAAGDNAVVVCHALTGSSDVDQWWQDLLGPGRSLDPDRDFVICANVLGSCYGSTGPTSIRPGTGRPWGADFPPINVRDMVEVQRLLLDALGVQKIRLVIGGSLGGLQALEWALLDDRVRAVTVIAASAHHSAWCIAQSEAQRAAIVADPKWCDGHYELEAQPAAGLAVARMMAICSYRSPVSFQDRFGRAAHPGGDFQISDWIRFHGGALVDRFDANAYVALTRAMDRHDVGHGRGGVARSLGSITVPVLVVSIDSDGLYPPAEQEELSRLIPDAEIHTLTRHTATTRFSSKPASSRAVCAPFGIPWSRETWWTYVREVGHEGAQVWRHLAGRSPSNRGGRATGARGGQRRPGCRRGVGRRRDHESARGAYLGDELHRH